MEKDRFVWKDEYSVGIKEIDDQHKELFKRINALYNALLSGKGKSQIGEMIVFLADYVVEHFDSEEKFMKKYNYPDYEPHHEIHEKFKQRIQELKKEYEENGATSYLAIITQRDVGDWLINHILKVDTKYIPYLKGKEF